MVKPVLLKTAKKYNKSKQDCWSTVETKISSDSVRKKNINIWHCF